MVPGADITAAGAALLAESGTIATLLPGPAFYLGAARYPAARLLIDSAAVAPQPATTRRPARRKTCKMMIVLACRNMHMPSAEAIAAAAINAAHALRRAETFGSLDAGKSADLRIMSVPDYRE